MKTRKRQAYNPFIDPDFLDDPITEIYLLLSHINIGDPQYEQRSSLMITHTTSQLNALDYYIVNANYVVLDGLKKLFKVLQHILSDDEQKKFTAEDIKSICSLGCLNISLLQAHDALKCLIDTEKKQRRHDR